MSIRMLEEGDKYCLVFNISKRKELKSYKKRRQLKEGYYCYVGEHQADIHKAGTVLFLRRLKDDRKVQENLKRMSEVMIDVKAGQKKVYGYLHYFSDNPLFQKEFHEAINS